MNQGTTGGDREKLMEDVAAGGIYAVIAPNMAKQIVALQVGESRGGREEGRAGRWKEMQTDTHLLNRLYTQ